jgi:hypothetical protein
MRNRGVPQNFSVSVGSSLLAATSVLGVQVLEARCRRLACWPRECWGLGCRGLGCWGAWVLGALGRRRVLLRVNFRRNSTKTPAYPGKPAANAPTGAHIPAERPHWRRHPRRMSPPAHASREDIPTTAYFPQNIPTRAHFPRDVPTGAHVATDTQPAHSRVTLPRQETGHRCL